MQYRGVAVPDWVPKRLVQYTASSRMMRWVISKPSHLLVWWGGLAAFLALGVALSLTVIPIVYLPAFVLPSALQIGADVIYVPRAFRARQAGDCWTPPQLSRRRPRAV